MNAQTPWIIRNAFQLPGMATEISDMIGRHMANAAYAEGHRSRLPPKVLALLPDVVAARARLDAKIIESLHESPKSINKLMVATGNERQRIETALYAMMADDRVVRQQKPFPGAKNRTYFVYSIAGAN